MSGGLLFHNCGLLEFGSRRHKAVSLSPWESELYAALSKDVENLGFQCGLGDGTSTRVTLALDNQGVVDHTALRANETSLAAGGMKPLDVVIMHTERNPGVLLT